MPAPANTSPARWKTTSSATAPTLHKATFPPAPDMQPAVQMHVPASALLQTSGLPTAWAGRSAWTVLDTSFGAGDRFMATWLAWQADPQRPTMLHYVGHISPEDYERYFSVPPLHRSEDYQTLHTAASNRAKGIHRLLLSKGQLSLTLCIGDSKAFFADHHLFADTLWVDALELGWDKWTAKALARLCSRGATLIADLPEGPNAAWLQEAGFVQIAATPTSNALRATFDPPWKLGAKEPPVAKLRSSSTSHCCVVGAGISGASVAYALARRGWRVTVLDKAAHPAAGASGLPAGLVVPHISADDSPRSRLSRVGARLMLQHAEQLLSHGTEWAMSGVLEHRFEEGPDRQHTHAGWIKPRALVEAWLSLPNISVRYGAEVHHLEHQDTTWSLFGAEGNKLLDADMVVFANAYGARAMLNGLDMAQHRAPTLPLTLGDLQAVHGTASLGTVTAGDAGAFGALPHNGNGCFITIPDGSEKTFWLAGSSFEPDAEPNAVSMEIHRLAPLAEQHANNLERLQVLLPDVGEVLAPQFIGDGPDSWSGTRCVTHDRLPLAGPVDAQGRNGLWIHVGMGARGLTFSALGAELIAARICGEPWPVESSLARSMDSQRLRKRRAVREVESDNT
ncbi:MAG: FAD-dependent oxidoreductase [Betaproteobacteria bacterium]|nr:FAD-dependent oxidoreductase [Betaproteobacteria bacterium]